MATPLTLEFGTIANTGQLYQFSRPVGAVRLTCISAQAADIIWYKLMNANAGDSLAFNNGVLSPAGSPAGPTAATYSAIGPGQTIDVDYFFGKNAPAPSTDPLQNKYTHIAVWCATATPILCAIAN